MAITVWGVDPSITETKWAILMAALGRGAWDETVSDTGGQLVCAPGGGSRQVTVQDGDCVAGGVLGQNTAPVTVTLDSNATRFRAMTTSRLRSTGPAPTPQAGPSHTRRAARRRSCHRR